MSAGVLPVTAVTHQNSFELLTKFRELLLHFREVGSQSGNFFLKASQTLRRWRRGLQGRFRRA